LISKSREERVREPVPRSAGLQKHFEISHGGLTTREFDLQGFLLKLARFFVDEDYLELKLRGNE